MKRTIWVHNRKELVDAIIESELYSIPTEILISSLPGFCVTLKPYSDVKMFDKIVRRVKKSPAKLWKRR